MPSPESQKIRAGFVKSPVPDNRPLDIQRREWEESALQMPLPPGTSIEAMDADGIACERVMCGDIDAAKVMLYLHGGGFNAGSPRTHRNLGARLSQAAGIPVLLVDYRLAPEHPFPAGVDDMVRVYRWLLNNRFSAKQISIGGDSAGAGLAMSALLALREAGDTLPVAAVLMSPMADMALAGESISSHATLDPLTSEADLQTAVDYYIGGDDPRNPLVSPVYADLHGLPPLLIHVGDHEVLLSDSIRLAEQATAAGVNVRLDEWPELWHVFQAWGDLPEAQESLAQIGAWLREKMASP
ncbi:MAG: alpha/beta hydrolase [Anaerolineae bacterium]|nr:alpha/beta hydrolase [Anaerolineae bacterium]